MIPKIIHCCWFGRKEIPQIYKDNINTWKKYLPDYEIKMWTEDNFDYTKCCYSYEAYITHQYAFVSDFVRADVLYNYGGMYLDMDVQFIKCLPGDFIDKSFVGFERRAYIGTAIIQCKKNSEIAKKLVDYYLNTHFTNEAKLVNNIANVEIFTDILIEYGLKLGGEKQVVEKFIVTNREVFYPKKMSEHKFQINDETCAIHQCHNSWMTEKEKRRGKNKFWIEIIRPILQNLKKLLQKIIGKRCTRKIEMIIRNKMR